MDRTSFWMEKGRRNLLFRVALVISLVILPWPWSHFLAGNNMYYDRLMQSFTSSETTFSIGVIKTTYEEQEQLKLLLARLLKGDERTKLDNTGFACDISESSALCVSNLPVRIDTPSGNITVHIPSNDQTEIISVRPYSGHRAEAIIKSITPVRVIKGNQPSPRVCKFNHQDPAMIFSSGFTGNAFHDFSDIIIPLFLTTRHFRSRVQLVLEDYSPRFAEKYRKIMSRLSNHRIMNVNPGDANERGGVHCFPGAIVGLRFHGHMTLNPRDVPLGTSMPDFRQFLRETYCLHFTHVSQIRQPTLMLLSRERRRMLLNENETISMMKELGFRVVVARSRELSNLEKYANVVNSCSVFVGVHGAGLVHELFLPVGAVVVQVEPLGTRWISATYYGKPVAEMGMHYMRYKIEPEESSLVELYGRNHSVIMDPKSIFAKGYQESRKVYLIQQNVRINVVKFRETLLQAFKLVTNSSSVQSKKNSF